MSSSRERSSAPGRPPHGALSGVLRFARKCCYRFRACTHWRCRGAERLYYALQGLDHRNAISPDDLFLAKGWVAGGGLSVGARGGRRRGSPGTEKKEGPALLDVPHRARREKQQKKKKKRGAQSCRFCSSRPTTPPLPRRSPAKQKRAGVRGGPKRFWRSGAALGQAAITRAPEQQEAGPHEALARAQSR